MRVLHFLNTFGATTTTFIHAQVKALSEAHKVKVICTYLEEQAHKFDSISVEVIPYEPNIWLQRIRRRLKRYNLRLNYYEPFFARQLNAVVETFQPDVIHCQFGPDALKFVDNLSYRKKDIPIFVQFRGYDVSMLLQLSPVYVRRLRELVQRPNIHPIFVAEYLYNHVQQYGIFPDRKRILYSCTDLSKFQRSNYPTAHKKVFLQVSSFAEKKGHVYTIEAFNRFAKQNPHADWQLVLAGDGQTRDAMMRKVAELGLESQIIFTGKVSHEEAKAWMERAHYFVHHSITTEAGDTEGIPNAIMEAMAMELPVISTYHAGIPELVADGVHGYLVPERDVEQYAERIAGILQWEYQPKNRQKVQEQFELGRHKEELIRFYEQESRKTKT